MKSSSILTYPLTAGWLIIALYGCAPTLSTSYRLEPVSGDVTTIDGRAVTKTEQNGVGVVASFEREDLEFICLDIEVKNRTDHALEVNPADFHVTALDAAQNVLTDPSNPSLELARTAADPTYEAGRMGMKRKQEEKRLKTAKILNTVLMITLVASDISSSSNSRTYREYATNQAVHSFAYQGLAVKRVIDRSTFANRMQRYDYEEYRWRELALKANTLAPGESVRGFVYLPKLAGAHYLAMTYTIPEQASVPVLFKQDVVQQKPTRQRR